MRDLQMRLGRRPHEFLVCFSEQLPDPMTTKLLRQGYQLVTEDYPGGVPAAVLRERVDLVLPDGTQTLSRHETHFGWSAHDRLPEFVESARKLALVVRSHLRATRPVALYESVSEIPTDAVSVFRS